jgi:DUF4097 and DUF4098 domain-containing protein YvlB
MDVNYELFIPRDMYVTLNTISGDVDITEFEGACEMETISGDIDLYVPSNSGVDFEISTISGSVYTDLDLVFVDEVDDLVMLAGREISAKLNQGGREVVLESISGNIYLRKK